MSEPEFLSPEPLSPERFRVLAEAYGGAVARWPAAVREDALRLAADPRFANILAEADALDALLDEWTAPAPSASLIEAVRARAPVAALSRRRRMRLWWSTIGIATALAGAGAGALAATVIVADPAAMEANTAFGDVAGQDS